MINQLDRLRICEEDFCNPCKWRSPENDEERSQDVHISQSTLEMIDVLSETARINCFSVLFCPFLFEKKLNITERGRSGRQH